MLVTFENVSKKYNREIIFKNLSYVFKTGQSYAITGPNGSGKSTLLQVISGFVRQSSGDVAYELHGKPLEVEDLYKHLSIATPYLELVEEFTLMEMINFHFKFKKPALQPEEILSRAYLTDARDKQIKKFSSGMKQRLKLALTLFTDSSLILLDEPTSNLDEQGTEWYKEQISSLISDDKTIIIASNQKYEYDFCDEVIDIIKYKS
ncbi:ABC transporter ATP-binding protein [Fulvivirga sp. RKSG066]|uniref:ABC transporter ATP-binding protein n=1 Tax=Fulvivirga aurantia TaxID=2529383 RepID=UPI0012BC4FFD|nr:ABC transporter ATP-binding protein [Fulvivirga aurantia]MTI21376.1 ABC transporter ATP-binding protein [Fulvivirga aurantia]